MKRLVVVSSSYSPFSGGQEHGLDGLIHGIRENSGCEVSVITPQYDRSTALEETRNGIKVYRYPTTMIPYPRKLLPAEFNLTVHMAYGLAAIPGLLARLAPDRVLAYFLAPTAFPAVRHARAMGVKCALFLGGSDVFQTGWPIRNATRFAMQNADCLIATSRFVRDCARMNFGILRKPFAVLPYGIDLDSFPGPRERPRGRPRVLCVQRLVASKGTHVLIKALRLIVDRGLSDVRVDIVGDGPDRCTLESMVRELGLQEQVLFHGEQRRERVVDFYRNSGIFCFPTLSEGFGIVLLEAMATGNVVLASRCTSIPEIVRDRETGILFEPGDEKSLASALEPILREPDQFRPLVHAATDAVREFDLARVGRRLADLLDAMPGHSAEFQTG